MPRGAQGPGRGVQRAAAATASSESALGAGTTDAKFCLFRRCTPVTAPGAARAVARVAVPCPWWNALPAEQRAVPRSAQSLRLSGLALAAPASVVFGEPIAAAILGVLHQLLNRRRSIRHLLRAAVTLGWSHRTASQRARWRNCSRLTCADVCGTIRATRSASGSCPVLSHNAEASCRGVCTRQRAESGAAAGWQRAVDAAGRAREP